MILIEDAIARFIWLSAIASRSKQVLAPQLCRASMVFVSPSLPAWAYLVFMALPKPENSTFLRSLPESEALFAWQSQDSPRGAVLHCLALGQSFSLRSYTTHLCAQ